MSSILSGIELPAQLTFSYGVGRAAGGVLEPQLQGLKNTSWQAITGEGISVPPSPGALAAGVAQGQIDPKTAALWATYSGVNQKTFDALVNIANTGPPLASALTLLRRNVWTPGQYHGALNRAAIEPGWWDGLTTLQQVWLTPAELAVMVQRGIVPNDGLLPHQPDTAGSNVPPMPQAKIDTLAEAAGGGINAERLGAMAKIIGLPASPDLAARMHFRKIITEGAFNQAILEGNTRGEWAPFLLEGFRDIPTSEQFVEAHLRGWITKQQMYDGTALHGMSQPDTDLEYQIHRRPLTPHQIKQALARGASFNPEPGEIQDPYTAAVHQNNLGPEWYEMGVALQGSYPSLFITNRLVTSGIITPADGQSWMQKSGMADEVVKALHDSWTGGGTTTADKDVSSAQTRLKTATHKSYIAGEIDNATATTALLAAGVTAAAAPKILALWAHERGLIRKQLSPAQIKRAMGDGIYTQPQALAMLLERGYDQAEATVLLEE